MSDLAYSARAVALAAAVVALALLACAMALGVLLARCNDDHPVPVPARRVEPPTSPGNRGCMGFDLDVDRPAVKGTAQAIDI